MSKHTLFINFLSRFDVLYCRYHIALLNKTGAPCGEPELQGQSGQGKILLSHTIIDTSRQSKMLKKYSWVLRTPCSVRWRCYKVIVILFTLKPVITAGPYLWQPINIQLQSRALVTFSASPRQSSPQSTRLSKDDRRGSWTQHSWPFPLIPWVKRWGKGRPA